MLGSFHDCALPVVQNLSNAEHSAEEIFGNVTVESELDGAIDGAFLVGVWVGSVGTLGNRRAMSASARKVDIASHRRHVGLVPNGDVGGMKSLELLRRRCSLYGGARRSAE